MMNKNWGAHTKFQKTEENMIKILGAEAKITSEGKEISFKLKNTISRLKKKLRV